VNYRNRINRLILHCCILPVIFAIGVDHTNAQQNFYDPGTLQQIEIHFSQSNWDYIMDTAKAGSGSYLMAQWVKINGVQFDSAGVKYKGSSSYDPDFAKNPLHISLDEFKSQNYQGYTSIKLSNSYSDPSMIREALAYSILEHYMDCSRSNFARVTINGEYWGLYTNDESVNKKFCSNHFYSSGNTFIKGNPELPGPYSKSNLKYISSDSSDYFPFYGMESDFGWNDLVELCNVTTNQPSALSSVLDIDRALWMLAFNNALVGLDSYTGWFSQNYYLYRDDDGYYLPVIWDLNMSFGGFPFAGTQGGGSGSLTVPDMQQLTPLLHDNHSDWPLIYVLMSNPSWKRMYIAHMRTIIEEHFSNGSYIATAGEMQGIVDTSVMNDPNRFFTYQQFQEGLTQDVQVGSYVVPGIANLMEARGPYLLSSPVFSTVPPEISGVSTNNPEPEINETVTITATVISQGQTEVHLGVRHDKAKMFQKQLMYDDGQHGDGAAGDHIYGASFIMSSLVAHYYIYAEITDANTFGAKFSPERAEHEYYQLYADVQTAQPGQVYINEFLAKNNLDTVNEFGNHEDWIELYNVTGQPLDLFGLYLTDDLANPDKFDFPENTIIPAGGFLVIWADEEDTTSAWLHCNFKLSADGEFLMLSDGNGLVLDSLTFGPQTADVSMGRCPNGTGPFDFLEIPTFNYANYCPAGTGELPVVHGQYQIVPNPAKDRVMVIGDLTDVASAELWSTSGQIIQIRRVIDGQMQFNLTSLPSGLFFILLRSENKAVLYTGKVIKMY